MASLTSNNVMYLNKLISEIWMRKLCNMSKIEHKIKQNSTLKVQDLMPYLELNLET
jgi:hypothetical protein